MKPDSWKNLSAEEQDWISAYLNGAIEPESFEALQDHMVSSAELRATIRRCLAIDDSLREFAEDSLAASSGNSVASWTSGEPKTVAFSDFKSIEGQRDLPHCHRRRFGLFAGTGIHVCGIPPERFARHRRN